MGALALPVWQPMSISDYHAHRKCYLTQKNE